jgi:hypothetical protein
LLLCSRCTTKSALPEAHCSYWQESQICVLQAGVRAWLEMPIAGMLNMCWCRCTDLGPLNLELKISEAWNNSCRYLYFMDILDRWVSCDHVISFLLKFCSNDYFPIIILN